MKEDDKVFVLKTVADITIDLTEDKISECKDKLNYLFRYLEDRFDLKDDSKKAYLGIPVCICEDGRGWSTCGGECPVHRPHYACTCGGCGGCALKGESRFCTKKVAYMKTCVRCTEA